MPSLSYARSYGAANVLNQMSSEGGVGIGWNTDGNMTSDQWRPEGMAGLSCAAPGGVLHRCP